MKYMKRVQWIAGILAGTIMLLCSGCGKAQNDTEETEASGTAVEVQTVSRSDIATQSRISGKVVARNEVVILPTISAKVMDVSVAVGDSVTKGQNLFQVDPSDIQKEITPIQDEKNRTAALYDAQIAQAQQGVADAKTLTEEQVRQAQQHADNTRALLEYGAASTIEVEKADAALTQAKISAQQTVRDAQVGVQNLQTAKANAVDKYDKSLRDLQDSIADTYVKATVSGTVTTVSVVQGGMASPQSPAITIATNEAPQISVSVSESVQPWLKAGDMAQVTIAALENKTFSAAIASVAPSADAATKLYEVRLDLSSDVNVAYGMFAEVEFQTDRRTNTVLIPTESIQTDVDTQYVFTVDGENHAIYVPVQTGLLGDGMTEITSGLLGGEQLVVKGQSYLADGAMVRIVTQEDKTAEQKMVQQAKTDTQGEDQNTSAGTEPKAEEDA